jgi:hypothetical protein
MHMNRTSYLVSRHVHSAIVEARRAIEDPIFLDTLFLHRRIEHGQS